jgi:hypothetical protein
MSINNLEVVHYENRRCKHSESVDLRINNKTIVSPVFAIRLKNADELNLFLEMQSNFAPTHLSAFVVRLMDVGKTLHYRLRRVNQTNLLGETVDPKFSSSLERDLILIDPALEYLYYSTNMSRLEFSPYVSPIIRNYAKRFMKEMKKTKAGRETTAGPSQTREMLHTNFWTCIFREANKRMKLIRDTFETEMKYRADLIIPPVPLVTSKHLLNVAIFMNEKSRAYAEGKRDCADYFILSKKVLTDDRMMSTIKEYIGSSSSPLTIFKFKNLNLNHEDLSLERRAFRELLAELLFLSQHVENKAFAIFESANQTFVSALSSIAIISTAFNLDREDRRNQGEVSRFASWYDPETMTLRNKQTLQTLIENNSGNIPCHCPTCSSSPYLMENNFAEYNQKVKSHYMHCREQEMKEIYNAIEKQDSLMGFDKLKRSPLRNLVDIIPS